MRSSSQHQSGFTLIEVLIAFVIIAIGLTGLAALQISTMNNQFEAYQRALVTSLVDDMATRIRSNPVAAVAGEYTAATGYGLEDPLPDCSAETGAARDLCEWSSLIAGVAVTEAGENRAAPLNAQGCIEAGSASGSGETVIRVTVVWQGIVSSAAPSERLSCGINEFGAEGYRRAIFRDVAVR